LRPSPAPPTGFWEAVATHFSRALAIRLRLEQLESDAATFSRALDRIGLGVLSLDASSHVLAGNATARSILARGDPLALAAEGLQACSPDSTRRLRRMVAEASRGPAEERTLRTLRLPCGGGRREVAAVIVSEDPAPAPDRSSGGRATLYLGDPERASGPRWESVREIFGLTSAEAKLLGEILEGRGLDDAAERLGISRATARTRLKTIFLKTDTHRQADLVRLVLAELTVRLGGR
jgi:DNA-binding CsgD family transcriptional regulator